MFSIKKCFCWNIPHFSAKALFSYSIDRICSIRDCFFCLRIVQTDKISSTVTSTTTYTPICNLINTTLSNQYSRRQENSVLRSIGLAPKQLAQMTVWEGMGYVVSSILLMLAIGLPITLLVWRKFSISAYAGRILPYEFPWLQTMSQE